MNPRFVGEKRLASVYKRVCNAARLPDRTLITPLGRRCQAFSVQRSFLRLLKIRISFAEADALAYQSNTARILQGCITRSGYPSLVPSLRDMKAAIRAQIRLAPSSERRIRGRDLILSSLREQVRLVRNFLPRIKAGILRSYWRWVDMTELHSERRRNVLTRNMLLRHVLHAADESARQQQNSLLTMLAFEIHNQALMTMCSLDAELRDPSDTSFKYAAFTLFDNLKQCINTHEQPPEP
jgi:hypothetical protein